MNIYNETANINANLFLKKIMKDQSFKPSSVMNNKSKGGMNAKGDAKIVVITKK